MKINISDAEQSQIEKLTVLVSFLYAMAMAAVLLRFMSRKVAHLKLWWDDWLILLAAIIFTIHIVCLVQAGNNGTATSVLQGSMIENLHWLYGTEITYSSAIACVKSSILCLYLRLFSVNMVFSKAVYGLMTLVVAWGISASISGLFSCNPNGWGFFHGQCVDMTAWFIGTTVPNIIFDVGILVLPLPVIWHLQLSTPRRIGLTGVFPLGIFTLVASIFRIYSKFIIFSAAVTWDYITPFVLWSTVEMSVGVICACLLVMTPLLRKLSCSSPKRSRGIVMQNYQHEGNSNRSGRPLCQHDSFLRLEQSPEAPRKVQSCLRRNNELDVEERSTLSRLESLL